MQLFKFSFGFFVPLSTCILYINRTVVETNPAVLNLTVDVHHDTTGQCVVNETYVTLVTVTNLRIYFRINLAADQFDKDLKRVFVSSVFDVGKVFKGKQSNVFVKTFFSATKNSSDFEYRMPLPPVIASLTK